MGLTVLFSFSPFDSRAQFSPQDCCNSPQKPFGRPRAFVRERLLDRRHLARVAEADPGNHEGLGRSLVVGTTNRGWEQLQLLNSFRLPFSAVLR